MPIPVLRQVPTWRNPAGSGCLRLACQNTRCVKIWSRDTFVEEEKKLWEIGEWGLHGVFVEPRDLAVNPDFVPFNLALLRPDLRIRALRRWQSIIPVLPEFPTRLAQTEHMWGYEYNSKAVRTTMEQNEYMEFGLDWFDSVEHHIVEGINSCRKNKVIDVKAFDRYFLPLSINQPIIRVWDDEAKNKQFLKELHFSCSKSGPPFYYLYEHESNAIGGVPTNLDWSRVLRLA